MMKCWTAFFPTSPSSPPSARVSNPLSIKLSTFSSPLAVPHPVCVCVCVCLPSPPPYHLGPTLPSPSFSSELSSVDVVPCSPSDGEPSLAVAVIGSCFLVSWIPT